MEEKLHHLQHAHPDGGCEPMHFIAGGACKVDDCITANYYLLCRQ